MERDTGDSEKEIKTPIFTAFKEENPPTVAKKSHIGERGSKSNQKENLEQSMGGKKSGGKRKGGSGRERKMQRSEKRQQTKTQCEKSHPMRNKKPKKKSPLSHKQWLGKKKNHKNSGTPRGTRIVWRTKEKFGIGKLSQNC